MKNYLLLETDRTAVTLPGGETFGTQLRSERVLLALTDGLGTQHPGLTFEP